MLAFITSLSTFAIDAQGQHAARSRRFGSGFVSACALGSMLSLGFAGCASSQDREQDDEGPQASQSGDSKSKEGSNSKEGASSNKDSAQDPSAKEESPSKEESKSEDASPSDNEDDPGDESEDEIPSVKFDLGALPESDGKKDEGIVPCEIDFLFVVDNSGSMLTKQQNLSNSVPKFAQTMLTSTDMEKDFHIGVVTTDENRGNIRGCDMMGGLIVQTKPISTTNMCGPYSSGKNFMTHEDDLLKTFTCAAKPGIGGNVNEKPLDALMAAIGPKTGAKGACNEGFMREDSLLAVIIITDEDDPGSPRGSQGNPEQWYQQLLAAKGGDEKKLVVISIVVPEKPNDCDPGDIFTRPTQNLMKFTRQFGKRGFVADVCAPNYDKIFQKAVGIIDFACGELLPPPG